MLLTPRALKKAKGERCAVEYVVNPIVKSCQCDFSVLQNWAGCFVFSFSVFFSYFEKERRLICFFLCCVSQPCSTKCSSSFLFLLFKGTIGAIS